MNDTPETETGAQDAAANETETAARTKPITKIECDLVRQLAAVLDETGLTEIEYEKRGLRIRVARGPRDFAIAAPAFMAQAAAAPATAAAIAKAETPQDPAHHPGAVKAPMVGVAYLLPEPGAAPFIKVGDLVSEGQTIVLIEAMKTFNPVKAPRSGKVSAILVENGSPVEYGEPLAIIV